jgi:hypothetical protein
MRLDSNPVSADYYNKALLTTSPRQAYKPCFLAFVIRQVQILDYVASW